MLNLPRWQTIAIIVVTVLAGLLALPNLLPASVLGVLPAWYQSSRINLGLDLRGGAHFLLEADLRGVMNHFVNRFFGEGLSLRFAPTYFPFVEPGVDIAMQCAFCRTGVPGCRVCKGTGYLEIGGAGMVHPRVFAHVGYDSEAFTGFAFGMGVERMAMLRHDISDIKHYYEGDVRFLQQF